MNMQTVTVAFRLNHDAGLTLLNYTEDVDTQIRTPLDLSGYTVVFVFMNGKTVDLVVDDITVDDSDADQGIIRVNIPSASITEAYGQNARFFQVRSTFGLISQVLASGDVEITV